MINTNYTKIGQEVYCVSRVGIEKCELASFGNENNNGYIKIHHSSVVDYNGNEICSAYGESYARESDLFFTLKEAVAFVKKTESDRFNEYKSSIKNLKDLLEFPINNSFSDGDGCQDGLIVKAYKERIFELTGIEI